VTVLAASEGLALLESDIRRQASVLDTALPGLRAAADEIAAALPRVARVCLIGCGDSYDAALASSSIWEQVLGVPIQAHPAMSYATTVVDSTPSDTLVVALSQSGRVSRVIEAVRASVRRGLPTVTITANPSSPLAAEPADQTWLLDFEKVGPVPGTTSHLLGIAALYELAAAIGGPSGGSVRADLDKLPSAVAETTTACWPTAQAQAAGFGRDLPVLLLGYGPTLSAARFTARKLMELAQVVAISQETEEYAHDEYSAIDERWRIVMFAPDDGGRARTLEVAGYLRRLGVDLAAIADASSADALDGICDHVYATATTPTSLAPFIQAVPGQILSVQAARRTGGALYGVDNPVRAADGEPQIYESAVGV
jgi:glucosamine--fructose-6-phosphate aminotransferase (isomerizing)